MTFKQLNLAEPLLMALSEKGYEHPTEIQKQAIPHALEKRDILGLAQTGTGKTAAFTLPIIQTLLVKKRKAGRSEIRALIITPTRELALQINDCIADYSKYTDLTHTVIFGGVKQSSQVKQLQKGVDILVATPGRLLDLLDQKVFNLNAVTHFVLDEADRMLDMGFIHDIKKLLLKLPEIKHTMFFSATMPPAINKLSGTILKQPIKIQTTPSAPVVEIIEQQLFFVEKNDKKDLLIDILKNEYPKTTLVFSRTKYGADKIAKFLSKEKISCAAIHGNKSQNARQRALSNFKSNDITVLIATDIASRGIDIDQLDLVINYDLPDVAETYIHRIGRTGRAGNSGKAISFCAKEEMPMLNDIQKLTGKKLSASVAT